uniref:2/3 transmembrane domain holin n=1 Tax=Candidatus Kentrum sp. LFY TaxID=2126342 RepID=A0A450WXL4_9GAMM|nr:MAG: Putative 2/3 transmembrane domain holin [Candidatus Kentron sp. LFY]
MHKLLNARMIVWLIISLLLFGFILFLAPQQLPVVLYKLALITSAAWVAYWLDRSLFPYARPNSFIDHNGLPRTEYLMVFAALQIRRAIIIGAAMLAIAMGA